MATPLTAAFDTQRKDGKLIRHKMKASTTIYKGGAQAHDANGLLKPFADAANEKFAGMAYESKTSDASTATYCRVEKDGCHLFNWFDDDSAAQADVGTEVYVISDAQVSPNASGSGATNKAAQNVKCGVVEEIVSTTQVYVRIDNYVR